MPNWTYFQPLVIMMRALIVLLVLFCTETYATAQISSRYYLPKDSLISLLKVDSLSCTSYWSEKKKGKTTIREDHSKIYIYNNKGRNTDILTIRNRDSNILEKWIYKYGTNDSIAEFTCSHFGESDIITRRRTYAYESLEDGWVSSFVIDSSQMNYVQDSVKVFLSKRFYLIRNDTLIADSIIRQYHNLSPLTLVKKYYYNKNGNIDFITSQAISSDSVKPWSEHFVYDEKKRIKEVYTMNDGRKNSFEKWDWKDEKNVLKIYSKSGVNGRKKVEYFKFDSENRLIEYSNDLNDKILRIYEISYYANGLIKRMVTRAPKDHWTHTQDYEYSYR